MQSVVFKSVISLCLGVWLSACSSSDKANPSSAPAAGGGGGDVAGSGGGPSAQSPLALPFFVNAPGNYAKSGFMGDAVPLAATAGSVAAAPSAANSDGTCAGNRASATAGGDCDTFSISPLTGAQGWQGVFYQFPAANWGMFPGRSIAPGATQVSFSVRASRSVLVKFQVGECDAANATDRAKCVDGFYAFPAGADASDTVAVGTDWAEQSISLSGVDYSGGVRGAFSWVMVDKDLGADTSPLSLYVDNITWE
jgi:hypothetical protein